MTRTPFDQFDKEMVGDALQGRCTIESDAEVPASTRRLDLWITPNEANASPPDHLGLLGRITSRSVTLEFFHNTPSGEELHMCLIKHGDFRHFLSRKKTLPLIPMQWVISSGRPDAGIDGLAFRPMDGSLHGIYESPPLHFTRLVVVSELPVTRDTLLVRLFGARSVLKHAITEIRDLPADAPERKLALPVLLRMRLTLPTDRAQQTSDDQEFLMSTHDIVENWRQEAIQEGVKLGVEQGRELGVKLGVEQSLERERQLMLRLLRRRFGAAVDGDVERRVAAASAEQIEVWIERVLSAGSLAELLAD